MRATRALLRRRLPLPRKRAERLPHVQQTNGPYHLPELGQTIADKAHRHGGAARFPDPAVHKSGEVDRALIDFSDQWRRDVDLTIVQTAKPHDAQTFSRLQSVPGIGKLLRLVRLYESHDISRFPRVQDGVAYGRLGTCAQESAGKR
jgi:Transposase IS116/IS110/IS902 family